MLFLKVIIIAFVQKKVLIIKTAKTHICILIIYKLLYVVCGVIIIFYKPFKQMPVNTRR
jgi:hypothetical protein